MSLYEGVDELKYKEFEDKIKKAYNCIDVAPTTPYQRKVIKVVEPEGTITINWYSSKKVMIQGSPTNSCLGYIDGIAAAIFGGQHASVKPAIINLKEITKNMIVGLDEAGVGESFGSLFLGASVIKKEDVKYFNGMLGGQNIRELDYAQIEKLFNALRDKIKWNVKRITAEELDKNNKLILMDRGYSALISDSRLIENLSNATIILDDYGVKYELKEFLEKQEKMGSQVIVESKADENYAAVRIASIVARKHRLEEMDRLRIENRLIDSKINEIVEFGSGNAGDPKTRNWLETYRRLKPHSNLPYFVRRKWANVVSFENETPRTTLSYNISCNCGARLNHVLIKIDSEKSQIICPSCNSAIEKDHFDQRMYGYPFVIDTSALIHRIFSKDLATGKNLVGLEFIATQTLKEEVDRKRPDQKRGCNNEMNFLTDKSREEIIKLTHDETEDLRGISNDAKLLACCRKHNAGIITKDGPLTAFKDDGIFVIQIIQ